MSLYVFVFRQLLYVRQESIKRKTTIEKRIMNAVVAWHLRSCARAEPLHVFKRINMGHSVDSNLSILRMILSGTKIRNSVLQHYETCNTKLDWLLMRG